MNFDRMRAALALVLVASTAALCLAPPSRAGGTAVFSGRIVAGDGVSPLAGARVQLLDLATGTEHSAGETRGNGGFATELPAGTYTVVVHTPEGAWLAAESLTLAAGPNRPLLLALATDRPAPALPDGLAAGGSWPTWLKWVVAGAIVVVGVVVVSEVTDDEEEPATPF